MVKKIKNKIKRKEEILRNIEESLGRLIDDYEREYLENNRARTIKKRQQLIEKCRDKIIDEFLK